MRKMVALCLVGLGACSVDTRPPDTRKPSPQAAEAPKPDRVEKQPAFLGVGPLTDGDRGCVINEVLPDSPAEKFGLRAGDVIRKMGAKEVKTNDDVIECIGEHYAGDEIEIIIGRNGKEQKFKLKFGAY